MRKFLPVALVFILGFVSCSKVVDKGKVDMPTLSRELTANEKQLVEGDRAFSYDIFRRTVAQDSTKNVFISPLSISMALGMTLNGSAGKTRLAMKEALHLQGMSMSAINESYSSLIELLTSADPRVKMKLANSIWFRDDFSVENSFKEKVKKFFDARIDSLDFSDPSSADKINEWVSNNTEGLISEIIKGDIPKEMVMYLINAIYFQGDWNYQFSPEKTTEADFATPNGTVQTDMMKQESELAGYVSNDVKMLDLAYGDSLFTMTLMMPGSEETSINNFVQQKLTSENVENWISQMSRDTTIATIPKFKMEYDIKMNDVLKSMGMEKAFNRKEANFSNINPDKQLSISEVKHKSFVQVNEEGTEASAVTSVGIELTSVGGPDVRTINFDRPFVFMIRERTSGTILFVGKMMNPS